MIGIVNADMFARATEPGEHVHWSTPDYLTAAEWSRLLGVTVEEYAETAPHMIVFEVLPLNGNRCRSCGCHVRDDHTPDGDVCQAYREERDRARQQ